MDGLTWFWCDGLIWYHGDHPSLQRKRMKSQRRWIPVGSFHPEDHGRFSKKKHVWFFTIQWQRCRLVGIQVLVSLLWAIKSSQDHLGGVVWSSKFTSLKSTPWIRTITIDSDKPVSCTPKRSISLVLQDVIHIYCERFLFQVSQGMNVSNRTISGINDFIEGQRPSNFTRTS